MRTPLYLRRDLGLCLGMLIAAVVGCGLWGPSILRAQDADTSDATDRHTLPGYVGVGGQVGRPNGLSLKIYRSLPVAYDLLLSTDFDASHYARVHYLRGWSIPNSPIRLFAGPGLFVHRDADTPGDRPWNVGPSAGAGLNYFSAQFEVFLQITPRVQLLRGLDGRLGGSVGLRYFF